MLHSSLDQAAGVLDYHINEVEDPDLYSRCLEPEDPLGNQYSQARKAQEYDGKILISPRSMPIFASENIELLENGKFRYR
jgi:hypothetical protein